MSKRKYPAHSTSRYKSTKLERYRPKAAPTSGKLKKLRKEAERDIGKLKRSRSLMPRLILFGVLIFIAALSLLLYLDGESTSSSQGEQAAVVVPTKTAPVSAVACDPEIVEKIVEVPVEVVRIETQVVEVEKIVEIPVEVIVTEVVEVEKIVEIPVEVVRIETQVVEVEVIITATPSPDPKGTQVALALARDELDLDKERSILYGAIVLGIVLFLIFGGATVRSIYRQWKASGPTIDETTESAEDIERRERIASLPIKTGERESRNSPTLPEILSIAAYLADHPKAKSVEIEAAIFDGNTGGPYYYRVQNALKFLQSVGRYTTSPPTQSGPVDLSSQA